MLNTSLLLTGNVFLCATALNIAEATPVYHLLYTSILFFTAVLWAVPVSWVFL